MLGRRPTRALLCALACLPFSVGALAGCGGSSKDPWQSAAPCLTPLGTFYDHGRPLSLPWRNPFGAQTGLMASPKPFQRELEVSYRAGSPGANAVALFFFAGDEDAQRVLRRIRSEPNFFPTQSLETIGPAIVRWSSTPAPGQHGDLAACIGG